MRENARRSLHVVFALAAKAERSAAYQYIMRDSPAVASSFLYVLYCALGEVWEG